MAGLNDARVSTKEGRWTEILTKAFINFLEAFALIVAAVKTAVCFFTVADICGYITAAIFWLADDEYVREMQVLDKVAEEKHELGWWDGFNGGRCWEQIVGQQIKPLDGAAVQGQVGEVGSDA
jgi:hypothetical protein